MSWWSRFQEVLDYNPLLGHNQKAPALWNEDPSYLREVKTLIAELQKLNSLLEAERSHRRETKKAAINFAKHFDTFFGRYTGTLGTGAAFLTLGVVVNLLQHVGLDPMPVWSTIGFRH
jgi:hypothetical protein